MKKKVVYTWLLLMIAALAAKAQTYTLTYQGFPYAKTSCALPEFAKGTAVKISLGTPNVEGKTFLYWRYEGMRYMPGSMFIMPAQDVELIPVYEGDATATEEIEIHAPANKIMRNGQLLIIYNGKTYNATGQQIQ